MKAGLVTLVCSKCGNVLTCSPGMVAYVLSGKGRCVKCEGIYKRPTEPDQFAGVDHG
jgi:primosomal protein N'